MLLTRYLRCTSRDERTGRSSAINDARSAIEAKPLRNQLQGSSKLILCGNYFYLLVSERYTDVRLVGAPPSSIGKYGSDTDNWEWPRHTGDFSVFRSIQTWRKQPHIQQKIFHWNQNIGYGINQRSYEGDFAMILGYPGRTQRYATSYEVNEL